MFHIGQRVVCVDIRRIDPEECPNRPVRSGIYTVRGFVVPYAGYSGTPGMLLEEIINRPYPYVQGTFEPSFWPLRFRPLLERKTDISVFTKILDEARAKEPA